MLIIRRLRITIPRWDKRQHIETITNLFVKTGYDLQTLVQEYQILLLFEEDTGQKQKDQRKHDNA